MYFTVKGLIDYFVVVEGKKPDLCCFPTASGDPLLTEGKKAYFEKVEEDFKKLRKWQRKLGLFTTSRIPRHHACHDSKGWASHLISRTCLMRRSMYGSYKVPSDHELEGGWL